MHQNSPQATVTLSGTPALVIINSYEILHISHLEVNSLLPCAIPNLSCPGKDGRRQEVVASANTCSNPCVFHSKIQVEKLLFASGPLSLQSCIYCFQVKLPSMSARHVFKMDMHPHSCCPLACSLSSGTDYERTAGRGAFVSEVARPANPPHQPRKRVPVLERTLAILVQVQVQ